MSDPTESQVLAEEQIAADAPAPEDGRSYVAFISYRHKELDREAAVRIQKKIENYVVPKEYREKVGGKKLGVCFRDEDELPASSSLSDSITYALDHTQFLIVICTPDLPLSKWCLQEITYFLQTHDRDHVLAVLVDGSPEESFPEPLRFTYDESGRPLAEVEPLAANIAGENHSINNKAFKKEVVRLFAAIIGCPFDALWQRERRARANRLVAAAGIVFAAMAIFLGVVLNKNAQISEQNTQILEQNDQIKKQVEQIQEQNGQIQEQNDQISEQNTKLQQQMSSVLVDSGQMRLEAYDRDEALKNALEALESGDPAIYDHRAEKLMTDALGTYADQTTLCTLLCEQTTAITSLLTTADGQTVVTADSFGTVRAFDMESGNLNWEQTLESGQSPRMYLINEHGLVICKTYDDCLALSLEDGSLAWAYSYEESSAMQVLSEDENIFVVLDRGIRKNGEDVPSLIFLDTATGKVLYQFIIPCDDFHVRTTSTLDYFYHYAGDFSANGSRFACAIPVVKEDEDQTKNAIFYLVDLIKGSIERVGSFSVQPDMIMDLTYYETDNAIYCAVSHSHHLYSVVFPVDKGREVLQQDYDYSLSSRSGFAAYDYMFQELPYLPPLNNSELAIVFSRNVVYLMDQNDGTMRNTINLDSAIVYAEWVDLEEEIFQVFTESGWCIQYNVSHYDNKAIESVNGESTPVKSVQRAALVRGGSVTNMKDGIIVTTRQDAPGQILLCERVSDANLQTLVDRGSTASLTYVTLSPSQEKLMAFSKNDDNNVVVEVYDIATGEKTAKLDLPFYVYSGEYQTSLLIPDDDHIFHDGTLYGLDGSVQEMNIEFPNSITYKSPTAYLLSDGSLLCTCECGADYGGYPLKELSVLSCMVDGVMVEHCDTIEDGLAIKNSDYSPHLLVAGQNGWTAAWGHLAYFDEKHIQKTTDEPVVAVKNIRTGEKFVIEDALAGVNVSQLIFAHTKPLLFVIYETGDVQLLDLSKGGRPILNTAYAYGELKSAAFSDQDSYLLVLDAMTWVDCYDTSTGEIVFSSGDAIFKKENESLGSIHALEDTEGKRLIVYADYSYNVYRSAAILDTEAWENTAKIGYFIALSPKLRTIVMGDATHLAACPYYTIKDLESQARDYLN